MQGKPIVSLNYIMNRTSKWQCVSIPSECPHSITNDTGEEVVIAWCYVSLKHKVRLVAMRAAQNISYFYRSTQVTTITGNGWRRSSKSFKWLLDLLIKPFKD